MVHIEQPITPTWQRAAERAHRDRQAGRIATRIGPRLYAVPSASGGQDHTVTIESLVQLKAVCDCIAGQRGPACRHAAALSEAARHIAACERRADRNADYAAKMRRFAHS